ncbi:DUF928 domain-containing protein [Leptolyngbyaceae cyanobacterium UHCC 1019]
MRMPGLDRIALHLGIALYFISTAAIAPALAQQNNLSRSEFPGRRIGGGTRGECLAGNHPVVALNPANNLGVTASDRPSLYFAVPNLDESYPVEFVLRDASGKSVYETALESSKNKDLVGIQVPKNTLKVGQDYQWYFSVVCDASDRSQNMVLSGWLRQVSPPVAIKDASGLEANLNLAMSYQKAGLWSDEIATLVELRQTHPHNDQVQAQWKQLLQQLELKSILMPSMASQL